MKVGRGFFWIFFEALPPSTLQSYPPPSRNRVGRAQRKLLSRKTRSRACKMQGLSTALLVVITRIIAVPWERGGAAPNRPPFSRWPPRRATYSCSVASTSAAGPAHARAHTLLGAVWDEGCCVGRPWRSDGRGAGPLSPHDASPPRQFSSSQRVSASPCRHCPAASLLCFASRRGCAQGGPAWLWLGAGAYQVTLLTELVLVVCHYPHLLLHDKAVLRELVVPRHVHRDLPPQERHCLRLRRACAPSLWAPHRFVHLRRPDEADQLAKLISDGRPRGGHGSSPRAVTSERRDEQRSSWTRPVRLR